MRFFIALPIPKFVKEEISRVIRGRLPVPYVNTTNLHITLNFFGELTDAEIVKVKEIFQSASLGKPFRVRFDRLQKFRQQIHIAVKKFPELLNLQHNLQKLFEASGFIFQDRDYYPHIKLTNLHMDKIMNPERKLELFPQEEIFKIEFEAEEIILYNSKLLLHHPKHEPIMERKLI
jgi:2'-5' RNA ligase